MLGQIESVPVNVRWLAQSIEETDAQALMPPQADAGPA
jgi:hypothetical protein